MHESSKKRAIFLLIAFLTFILLTVICHYIFLPDTTVRELDKNWTVQFNDKKYAGISLKDLRKVLGGMPQKGDVLSLTTEISPDPDTEFPTLVYLSRYSASEVLINDEIVSSIDMDNLEENAYIGTQYVVLTLEKSNTPVTLTIRLYINENNAYSFFEAPLFGEYNAVVMHLLFTHMFALAAGVFLIIFGMAFLIITIVFYKTLPDILSQLFSSILFIDLGVWILCYFKLSDIFLFTAGHASEIEYYSLFLIVPIIYMIISCMQKHYSDWVFMVIASTSSVICLFLVVLHVTDISHVNESLIYYHFIAVLCVIFLVITIGKDIIQKKLQPSEIILLSGIGFLLLSFVLNLFSYVLEMTGFLPMHFLTKHLIPMGGLIFVFTTLINYFIYLSESFARRKEYESLTHLAYADGLTNLPNRSRYEKYLDDLDKSKKKFCIISLDLNGLKQINDNDGHAKGDRYLQEFGTTLSQCFENKAFIARIGGDEFVAIMTEEYWDEVDTTLHRLNDALEVKNVLYPEFKRSVAAGYAYSTEIPESDPHAVYLLADKRMYEKKKKMHEKLGISARI